MGGIVREKATGASLLTLSLPVSRALLLGVRVGVGVLEAIILAVVPWTAIFLVSSHAGMPILVAQKTVRVARLVRNLDRVSSQALYQSTIQFSFTVSRKMSRNATGATSTETAFKSRACSITASAFLLAKTRISCP